MEVINGTNAINAVYAINVNDNEFRPPLVINGTNAINAVIAMNDD